MIWWIVVGMAGLLLVGIGLTWRRWAVATINFLRRRAGYARHTIGLDGFELVYYESGRRDAPTMLLLHGFGANADTWVALAPLLRQDFRLIMPDLPGFGDTGHLPGKSYSLDAQVARLKDFADMLHLDHVHVVGNSMGGYIAAAFAAANTERVASLALFDAAGVDMPVKSPFYEAALAGNNMLLVREPADFERILQLIYHKVPFIPGYLRDYLIQRMSEAADAHHEIFEEMFGQRVWLDMHMEQLNMPTLVLWGDDDRVLDISSIKLFQAGIPHAEVAIVPACGHVPQLEKPQATARVYREFLERAKVPIPAPVQAEQPAKREVTPVEP
ncbi:MAG: alpha/beta fold hydrolase [Burkholderiales bacterium]|nr:alpha/beta fold hydrolase [Burkholderiales bacterium]